MTMTVTPTIGHSDYPTAARVTAHVAVALGVKESTAHQLLYGRERLNAKVVLVVEAMTRCGDRAALSHFLAPIEAAVRGIPIPTNDEAVADQAGVADSDEETAQGRYERCPCERHAREYVLAIDTERAMQLERRRSVAARHGLA